MRVPLSWLRDYVRLEMPLDHLTERIDISSAVVASIEHRGVSDDGGNLGLFRAGKVLSAAKHPNADRLQLCVVDVGEGDPTRSSTGRGTSERARPWQSALPGAKLPEELVSSAQASG